MPYTIFGQIRAAIYMGDMYVVLNAAEPVRKLTRHFDNLIRAAEINAHEAAGFARSMAAARSARAGHILCPIKL